MRFESGSKLGQYEIVSPLGAGGMGEVYRARDTKLGREVAIKLILDDVASDPERLARFGREARVLASLNHPNIATLHGFEADGERSFLIMELVEGETLADRIQRGPLPVDEALPLFLQIAEGLKEAHERGVIHRDLKPANLRVTENGGVKILDFGLAKALGPDVPAKDPSVSHSPTMSLAATRRGEILGTAAYMSPEQAAGRTVDKRTDIWAFGACFYEALRGRRAFEGENAADTLAAVLRDTVDLEALPDRVPLGLRLLIERCLVRDPRNSVQDIGDVRLELERAREPSAEETGHRSDATAGSRLLRAVPWVVAAVAILAAAFALTTRPGLETPGPTPAQFQIDLPPGTDFAEPIPNHVIAISPDGEEIVWSGKEGEHLALYRRGTGSLAIEVVPGTEGGTQPFFSPDGRWLGFHTRGELRKVPAGGGTAVKIAATRGGYGGVWTQDGDIYFAEGFTLERVPAEGGEPELVTRYDLIEAADPALARSRYYDPRGTLVPGSSWLIFSLVAADGKDLLVAFDPTSGAVRVLAEGAGPRLLPSGHLLFARRGALFAALWDNDAIGFKGEPIPVLDNVDFDWLGYPLFDVSRDGTLVYVPSGGVAGGELVVTDRSGTVVDRLIEVPELSLGATFSPQGDSASVALPGSTSGLELWTLGIGRSVRVPLTFGADSYSWTGVWSPDGSQIAFVVAAGGAHTEVMVAAADGSGDFRPFFSTEDLPYREDLQLGDWSSSGRFLSLTVKTPEGGWDLWTYDRDQEELTRILGSPFNEINGRFSADDRWIAYETDRAGIRQIFVREFPQGGAEAQISTQGGRMARWAGDGQSLYFLDGGAVMNVRVFDESGRLAPGQPELVFEGPFRSALDFDVTSDGERFLLIRYPEGRGPRIHVVQSWLEQLERLLPPG